jgi:hypothetical protein
MVSDRYALRCPAEQLGGEAADVRSDIYNLATVLYECATGVLPWSGHTFSGLQAKLQDPPPMKKRASRSRRSARRPSCAGVWWIAASATLGPRVSQALKGES